MSAEPQAVWRKSRASAVFQWALHDIMKKVRWQAEEKGLILHAEEKRLTVHTACREVVEFFATLQKNAAVHKAVRHTDRTTKKPKKTASKATKDNTSGGNAGGLESILEMCICLFSSLEICYWQDRSFWLYPFLFLKWIIYNLKHILSSDKFLPFIFMWTFFLIF